MNNKIKFIKSRLPNQNSTSLNDQTNAHGFIVLQSQG